MPLNPSLQLHTFGAMQFPWMQGLEHIAKTYNYISKKLHDQWYIRPKIFLNKILRRRKRFHQTNQASSKKVRVNYHRYV